MKQARNIKNLKPFKKGETGNPNGRPPKLPKLDELLAEVLGNDNSGVTTARKILEMLSKKAMSGDVRAAEILLDRAYGKSKQVIESQDRTIIRVGYGSAPGDGTSSGSAPFNIKINQD